MKQVKEQGKYSTAVFLDLSEVFDMLNHGVLLKKLERYGIRGTILEWFTSYLHRRSLRAKVTMSSNSITNSKQYNITYRIAQGSCLGPLLFILFCNDIYKLPSLILFADDTTLLNHHQNRKFLEYTLNHNMDLLNNWFKANQLSLNMSKTVLISFWDNKGEVKVLVGDTQILNVQTTKFLEVTVDHTLSWDAHVNNLLDKLMINKLLLAVSSNLLNLESLKLIYYAHIQSHLVYGLSVWGNMTSSKNITKIFKMQKACAKMAGKQSKRAPVLQTLKNLKLLTIHKLIYLELCRFGYTLAHQVTPTIQNILNSRGGQKTHHYNTGNKTLPSIQKHSSTQYNKSFMCKGPIKFNQLPTEIRNSKTIAIFRKKLKNHLLTKD